MIKALRDHPDPPASWAHQDLRAYQDRTGNREKGEKKDHLDQLEPPEREDHRDHRESKGCQVNREIPGTRVTKVTQAFKD